MKKWFGDKEFLLQMLSIALPLGLQSVINMVVNLIDTIMIGSMGDIALSSVNIGSQFFFLYAMTCMGISNAASVIASQAWGNKRPDKVKAMISYTLKICTVMNLIFFTLAFLFPQQILSIYTDNLEIQTGGAVYLKILSAAFLFQSYSQLFVYMLRPCGVHRLGFIASLFACFANIFFNWVFIFGHLGAPALGVAGAAVGTVLARVTEFIISAGYSLFKDRKLGYRLNDLSMTIDPLMRRDFRKIGFPTILSEVTQTLNVSAAAMITGRVSEYYIAANTIVHNIWMISSLFMFGLSMGASVMIGKVIGAGDNAKAKEYAEYFIRISIAVGAAAAVLTLVIAPFITSLYNVSQGTLETAEQLKYAAAIAVFFNAIQIVSNKGILRGGGRAGWVTKVDLISCWLVNIPVGFVVALVLHMDPFWIYLSLRIDYVIKMIWGQYTVRRKDWILRMNVD